MTVQSARGFTLVELMVTTAIIAIAVGLSAGVMSFSTPSVPSRTLRDLTAARDSAIRFGERVTWRVNDQVIVFYPDGSSGGGVVTTGGHRFMIDRLTGATSEIP